MKTVIEEKEFRGHPMLVIFEVDDEGKPKPLQLIGFGKKKAKAILNHIKEIENFAKDVDKKTKEQ